MTITPSEGSGTVGRARLTDPVSVGLDRSLRACLFDLDGVLTRTATIHAAARKEMFDAYLCQCAQPTGAPFVAFDAGGDHASYMDGKSRADGTRSFLASRGTSLSEGSPQDRVGATTVQGLGNDKNELVRRGMREEGVEVVDGSVPYVQAARWAGLRCAVVPSAPIAKSC